MSESAAPGGFSAASDPNARPPPMWVGDHLALDFLNSTAVPRGTAIEWVANGADLVSWMRQSGALDSVDAKRVLSTFRQVDLDHVAREAVDLREWFRDALARAKAKGVHALPAQDIERLNAVLTRDAAYRRIKFADGDGRLRLIAERAWRAPGELLVPIANAMADLLCEGDLSLVRNCENPPCTMWFYDRTKSHRRRWCSQAICGNRAKVAAFRDRKRRHG